MSKKKLEEGDPVNPFLHSAWDHRSFEPDEKICANCQWWFVKSIHFGGECRRHAPRPTGSMDLMVAEALAIVAASHEPEFEALASERAQPTYWPTTDNHAGCGEFLLRAGPPKDSNGCPVDLK